MEGRILFSCLLLALLLDLCSGLEQKPGSNSRICWQCLNSWSDKHCFRTGKWVTCSANEFCVVEIRMENGIEKHSRGCKQDASCDSLIMQDQISCAEPVVAEYRKKYPTQPMVCRHCCFEDYCNPPKVMKDTIAHVLAFPTKRERGKFMRDRRASSVKSIRGRKPKPNEIYYPGFGWISWPTGAIQSGMAFPPFSTATLRTVSETNTVKKTAVECDHINLHKTPAFVKMPEQCVISAPVACVADGTIIFRIEKMQEDMELPNNIIKKNMRPADCPRTPTIETMMVYDEGDHYVVINRVNHRHGSKLPMRKKGHFYVGDAEITDYYSWETIKGFKRGRG